MSLHYVTPLLALGLALGAHLQVAASVGWLVAALVFLLVGRILPVKFQQPRAYLFGLVAFSFGVAYATWQVQNILQNQWPAYAKNGVFEVTVKSLPEENSARIRFLADVKDLSNHKTYRMLLSDYHLRDGWEIGSRWQVQARIRPTIGALNIAGFDREQWALTRNIAALGTLGKSRELLGRSFTLSDRWEVIRGALLQRWETQRAAHPWGAGMMAVLALGERRFLDANVWQALSVLGLSHLFSISGLHIGLAAMWAALLMRYLLRFLPKLPVSSRTVALVFANLIALLYAALAGFATPTQRALVMLWVFSFAWLMRRHVRPVRALLIAAVAVLILDPLATLSAGFWLSFGMVAVLILGANLMSPGRSVMSRVRQFVRVQTTVALAAPFLAAYFFGSLPLISYLANLVAIPLFSLIFVPLALLSSFLPLESLMQVVSFLGDWLLRALVALSHHAPSYRLPALSPFHALLLIVALSLLLLPRGTGLKPLAALIVAATFVLTPKHVAPNRALVRVWDVGQGLAVSVATQNYTLLFDTGVASAADLQLIPSLEAVGVSRLDTLILSHHDADHDGGASHVINRLKPHNILAGQPMFYAGATWCGEKESWTWDGVAFDLLTLENDSTDDNAKSCVLRVRAGSHAVLITGDARDVEEFQLVEKYGESLKSDVLVLGHHGSKGSSSDLFLQRVKPLAGIASSGFANPFHHPHPDVAARLSNVGAMLYRTDLQGALEFVLKPESAPVIRLMRENQPFWRRKPTTLPAPPAPFNPGSNPKPNAAAKNVIECHF